MGSFPGGVLKEKTVWKMEGEPKKCDTVNGNNWYVADDGGCGWSGLRVKEILYIHKCKKCMQCKFYNGIDKVFFSLKLYSCTKSSPVPSPSTITTYLANLFYNFFPSTRCFSCCFFSLLLSLETWFPNWLTFVVVSLPFQSMPALAKKSLEYFVYSQLPWNRI